MFDIKVYQDNEEKETIQLLNWIQMTAVQAALSRFGIHYFSKQVSEDTLLEMKTEQLTAAQARITALETALQALVNFDDKNYYQRVHITQEPDVMKQARAALETKP